MLYVQCVLTHQNTAKNWLVSLPWSIFSPPPTWPTRTLPALLRTAAVEPLACRVGLLVDWAGTWPFLQAEPICTRDSGLAILRTGPSTTSWTTTSTAKWMMGGTSTTEPSPSKVVTWAVGGICTSCPSLNMTQWWMGVRTRPSRWASLNTALLWEEEPGLPLTTLVLGQGWVGWKVVEVRGLPDWWTLHQDVLHWMF